MSADGMLPATPIHSPFMTVHAASLPMLPAGGPAQFQRDRRDLLQRQVSGPLPACSTRKRGVPGCPPPRNGQPGSCMHAPPPALPHAQVRCGGALCGAQGGGRERGRAHAVLHAQRRGRGQPHRGHAQAQRPQRARPLPPPDPSPPGRVTPPNWLAPREGLPCMRAPCNVPVIALRCDKTGELNAGAAVFG